MKIFQFMKRTIVRRSRLLLLTIVIVGTILRIIGLYHGITYHPDERGNVMHVMRLSFDNLNPKFFAYGSFPLYLLFFIRTFFSLFSTYLSSYDGLFRIGRVISVLFGVGSIIATYLIGKRMYTRRIGLFASLFLSLSVIHIQYCHFYAVDIWLTLMVAIIFLALLGIARNGRMKNYIVTGILFGIGLATKISILPLMLTVVLSHFIWVMKSGTLFHFRQHWRLIVLFLVIAVTFSVCQPYTYLDYKKFSHDVREQSSMVRGIWQPPYTIQYEKTVRYLYHIDQMMKWSIGYPLVIAGLLGMILSLFGVYKRWYSIELLLLSWLIPYFLITGSFKVKFLRYMLPILPFLCLLAARFFDVLIRDKSNRTRYMFGLLAVSLTVVYLFLYSIAFVSIYTRPHTYITASKWIYKNISSNETILGEHWDDKLPVSVRGSGKKPRAIELPMYEKDNKSKISFIADALEKGDYIALPTKRVYGSVGKMPERYPVSARYYQLLLSGKLGYQLVKTFQSYPTIFGFELVDDLADESYSVYDHPKIYIFKKKVNFTKQEYLDLLTTPLPTSELISFEEILRARTFGEQEYQPFEADKSLLATLKFYLYIFVCSILMLPISLSLCRSNFTLSYPLSKLMAIVLPAFILWFIVKVGLLALNTSTIVLCLFILMFISFVVGERLFGIAKVLAEHRSGVILWEVLFGLTFLVFLLIRAFNPEIFWGEKPMDFSFLNACYRTLEFPITDPWFSGKNVNYYYFGYLQAAFIGRLIKINPAIMYNLFMALVPALSMLLCVSFLLYMLRRKIFAIIGGIIIIFGGNLAALYQIAMFQRKVNFDLWWATSRVLPSPAINEYPIWSFLFSDFHAHVVAIPVALSVLLFSILLMQSLTRREKSHTVVNSLVLSFFLGILVITNSWDFIPYSAFILFVLPFSAIADVKRDPRKARFRTWFVLLLSFFTRLLLGLCIVSFSFIWTFLYHMTYNGPGINIGLVKQGFASIEHILIHFGHFIFVVAFLFLYILHRRSEDRWHNWHPFTRWKLFKNHNLITIITRDFMILVSLALVCILIYFLPRSAFILGLLIALIATVISLSSKRSFRIRMACFLIATTGYIIAGAEFIFVIDRMNTIFKFYYPGWIFLGIGCSLLLPLFMGHRTPQIGSSNSTEPHFTDQSGRNRRFSSFKNRSPIFYFVTTFLAFTIIYGSIIGIGIVTKMKRVPTNRPTLDGRKYLLLSSPEIYGVTRWINQNVQARPVIAEAQGPAYQNFSQVSMHTGLPTLVGWEHHIFQRGAPRSEIRDRKRDLRLLYTSSQEEVVRSVLEKYNIRYVVFGKLERKTYLKEREGFLSTFPEILHPVYRTDHTVLYQAVQPGEAPLRALAPETLSIDTSQTVPPQSKTSDWQYSTIFKIPSHYTETALLYGITVDRHNNIFVSDAKNNVLFKLTKAGKISRIFKFASLQPSLNYPTSLVCDPSGMLWISDTGNNRVVGFEPQSSARSDEIVIITDKVNQPAGLTVDGAGNLYIANHGNDTIVKYTSEIAKTEVISINVAQPLGLHYITSGFLIAYSVTNRAIQLISLGDDQIQTIELEQQPDFILSEGYIAGNEYDKFYFADSESGTIKKFSFNGEIIRSFSSKAQKLMGITTDMNDCVLYIDSAQNNIMKLCPPIAHNMFEGGEGNLPGKFAEPRTISQDSKGYFYIADTRNHRIQKFDSYGNYVHQWGQEGDDSGQFREPMGIAVGADDLIYVADTWNSRIQVFDHLGNYKFQWADSFYGPRDICHEQGYIYVSDTGNSLIKVYDRQGQRIRIVSKKGHNKGEIDQPVGIAVKNDSIYSCDSGNHRIQVFHKNGAVIRSFIVPSWKKTELREPYIASLPDNNLVISDTALNRLLFYDDQGNMISSTTTIGNQRLNQPRDVYFSDRDQTLYIVDTWNHCIRKIALMDLKALMKTKSVRIDATP